MSRFGIDVSEHQGNINWDIAKNKIDFAILRIGWIGNKNNHKIDKQFERNYNECKRLGIPVGVYAYCYSNNENTAREGANWVVNNLNDKILELPVYIDMEDSSIASLGRDRLTNICVAFNSVIENSGRYAGVYANLDWFNNKLNKDFIKSKYTTWIAHYTSGTNRYEGDYDMWQNSSKGYIEGIGGNIDTNYMYRDLIAEIGKYDTNNNNNNVGSDEEVRRYENGSTIEPVYADTNLSVKIGSLNPYEKCDCFGIFNNRAIVRYKIDNTNNYKVGYVKWLNRS